jgi:hypothetical protein
VAGAAVFPSSGQAHPTLTIVALAIRLARYIEVDANHSAKIVRLAEQPAELVQAIRVAEPVSELGA